MSGQPRLESTPAHSPPDPEAVLLGQTTARYSNYHVSEERQVVAGRPQADDHDDQRICEISLNRGVSLEVLQASPQIFSIFLRKTCHFHPRSDEKWYRHFPHTGTLGFSEYPS